MTIEELEAFRKKLRENYEKLSEEERSSIRESNFLHEEYNRRYPEGIPFQMPYSPEELKEAIEKDKPFHTWEKYKGWYGPVPDDWIL